MGADYTNACRRGAARFSLRWPHARLELERRLKYDERVVELCEAYETACAAAEHWLRSNADIAPARVEEYRSLAVAMEQDILSTLSSTDPV
jgi:hypothetical protein